MVMPGLVFDVTQLVSRPSATLRIQRSVTVPGLSGPLGSIGENEPVQVDLAADSVTDGVAVTGTVSGTTHLSCSRCLSGSDRTSKRPLDETHYLGGAAHHAA